MVKVNANDCILIMQINIVVIDDDEIMKHRRMALLSGHFDEQDAAEWRLGQI